MSLPGQKHLRHWFWAVMFRFPKLRLRLTRLLVPAREMDVQIFGAPLRIDSREEIGLWRASKIADENVIFRDEAASLLNLALLLQPGDVFIDIGANVGLYSSALARLRNVFAQNEFVAIEANPATAARLQRSVDGRGVAVMNLGVSDRATELAFAPGVTSGVFKVAAPGEREGVTKIHCDRLDALPLPAGDLVMKIDVEDHELPVLEGAAGLFAAERIKVIYLDGYRGESIPPLLRGHGFALFDGRTLARVTDEVPAFSLLAVHQSRLTNR
ncbi:MAG: FkbM family methyltransferase [Chthoniobacterales bacterium]